MTVEIWSDVICPFCYIGKRRFEEALNDFEHKSQVDIVWRSFQLNADMVTNPTIQIDQYLADSKGWTLAYAQQFNARISQLAAEVGLSYHFDKAVVANSFNAHRFTHLASKHGLGALAEERLFQAYFTAGKNIDDRATLVDLGLAIGLEACEIEQMLETDDYADQVKHDIAQAQYLGIKGVPFFVMNNKYAVSGAQAVPVFEQTLQKAFDDWQQENPSPKLPPIAGAARGRQGSC